MKKFNNTKQQKYLSSLPQCSIETSNIATRCKFNFSYFDDTQSSGQSFSDWDSSTGLNSLSTLLDKIKEFTKQPLMYWNNERVGKGNLKVLEYYQTFPKNSDFKHPPYIPHDACWARFRLGSRVRLIGFVIPETVSGQIYLDEKKREYKFDGNTFYVVFLDKNHVFYKTEEK